MIIRHNKRPICEIRQDAQDAYLPPDTLVSGFFLWYIDLSIYFLCLIGGNDYITVVYGIYLIGGKRKTKQA